MPVEVTWFPTVHGPLDYLSADFDRLLSPAESEAYQLWVQSLARANHSGRRFGRQGLHNLAHAIGRATTIDEWSDLVSLLASRAQMGRPRFVHYLDR